MTPNTPSTLRLLSRCAPGLTLGGQLSAVFDLPAGDAATTLAWFAEQADLEIVFSPSVIKGVQTNAVTGEYAPREGLDRLVAGSGLVVARNSGSGAFSVQKNPR